ncbi:phage portal protein [Mycolicibacterium agri]|uniref:Portal protein n=1 Tax=Mycolicibacterium agri TaxID=36811 RepID=A0A2A7MN31_MYCAG|nr:phage portal protein [Mycolicibacterium agri]PEG33222.1 phage portal protein [Mycolicibacterium agri]GFG49452.1 portal protein [Mycolicibacterium agri]
MSLLTRLFRSPDPPEERSVSIADPAALSLFGVTPSLAGVSVSDRTAMGLSAVYRCVSLISGSIASLPLRTVVTQPDGTTQRTTSWLDDPAGPHGVTAFEWVEFLMVSLLLHGNAYFLKVFGGAGQLLALQPLPPQCVGVEVRNGRKLYRVQLESGQSRQLTDAEIVHIPGISLDGVCGVSPITIAKNSLGAAIASERSAARLFSNGLLSSAIVTPEDTLSEEEAAAVKDALSRKIAGEAHAGDVSVINRKLKITPWSVNPADAQFLESRAFAVDEVSRWFGIPPHLLGQTEKQTSFGAGLSEQNRGYAKYTLEPWTRRVEARLTRLLPANRKAEFDFRSLVSPDPETEIRLLIDQVASGLLSLDEARAILNRKPLEKGGHR